MGANYVLVNIYVKQTSASFKPLLVLSDERIIPHYWLFVQYLGAQGLCFSLPLALRAKPGQSLRTAR